MPTSLHCAALPKRGEGADHDRREPARTALEEDRSPWLPDFFHRADPVSVPHRAVDLAAARQFLHRLADPQSGLVRTLVAGAGYSLRNAAGYAAAAFPRHALALQLGEDRHHRIGWHSRAV